MFKVLDVNHALWVTTILNIDIKEDCTMKKLGYLLLTFIIVASFGTIGCSSGSDTSVSPNTAILHPTGTIEGVLVDKVTNKPIAGAVIDIGVAQAVTSKTGGFVLRDVPATADPAGTGGVTGTYVVTIDLTGVNNAMPAGSDKYPDYSYASHKVSYSTLNDTTNDNGTGGAGGDTATNHDTPVTGLVGSCTLKVGKLSTAIEGVVAYDETKKPATAEAWTVLLLANEGMDICTVPACYGPNSATGADGNIVAKATTAAGDASFSFTNIEALTNFIIIAFNGDQSYFGMQNVMSPPDGETTKLVIQNDDPNWDNSTVFVARADALAPVVVSVTPEDSSDLPYNSANTTQDVVFTFSEKIKANSYSDGLSASTTGALNDDIQVTYDGVKAGNVAYSLAWNTAHDTLTVTIPVLAPSSKYTVDLSGTALTDEKGLAVANIATVGKGIVHFSTSGGATASPPSSIIDLNAPQDWLASAKLDWLPSAGSKKYNVYKRTVQWPGTTSEQVSHWELLHTAATAGLCYTTALTEFSDAATSLVEGGNIQLRADYKVHGVNSDCVESTTSVTKQVLDEVSPSIDDLNTGDYLASIMDSDAIIRVVFSEPLEEGAAETLTNYTINASAFVSTFTPPATNPVDAVYVADTNVDGVVDGADTPYVDLYLSKTFTAADLNQTAMTSGNNGICDNAKDAADTWASYSRTIAGPILLGPTPISQGNGQPYTTCLTAGGNTTIDAVLCDRDGDGAADAPVCDDQIVDVSTTATPSMAVISGLDGICQTKKQTGTDDVQSIIVNQGLAGSICISAGADMLFTSTLGTTTDDAIVLYPLVTVNALVEDVAANGLSTTANEVNTDATVQ